MPQSLSQVYIHIVFSTKEREAYLNDEIIRKQLYAYLAAVLKDHNCPALLINGTSDHVHILCNMSRTHTISDVIRQLKRGSTKWLKKQRPEFEKFQWQAGYGVFSVSASNVSRVKGYISRQEEHHKKMNFKEEFTALLKKHMVKFDERYLWD